MPLQCINKGGAGTLLRLVETPQLEQTVALTPDSEEALRRWQARPGEILTVQDPDGHFFRARWIGQTSTELQCVPFEPLPETTSAYSHITVCQAIPDRERFELVLEKLTELGVDRIVPMVTDRSATVAQRDHSQRKSHRWPDLLLRASRQCRRPLVPELCAEVRLEDLWDEIPAGQGFLLCEKEEQCRLRQVAPLENTGPVWLLVGPEGGFSPEEVVRARDRGMIPVTLGPAVFRTETAAIIGAALLQYLRGHIG